MAFFFAGETPPLAPALRPTSPPDAASCVGGRNPFERSVVRHRTRSIRSAVLHHVLGHPDLIGRAGGTARASGRSSMFRRRRRAASCGGATGWHRALRDVSVDCAYSCGLRPRDGTASAIRGSTPPCGSRCGPARSRGVSVGGLRRRQRASHERIGGHHLSHKHGRAAERLPAGRNVAFGATNAGADATRPRGGGTRRSRFAGPFRPPSDARRRRDLPRRPPRSPRRRRLLPGRRAPPSSPSSHLSDVSHARARLGWLRRRARAAPARLAADAPASRRTAVRRSTGGAGAGTRDEPRSPRGVNTGRAREEVEEDGVADA